MCTPYSCAHLNSLAGQVAWLPCMRAPAQGQGIRWEDFYAYQHYAQAGAARVVRGW